MYKYPLILINNEHLYYHSIVLSMRNASKCTLPPGHVSHSHPGSYLNQATAQICSSNNQASTFNLEPRDKNSKVQAVFSEMEETSGVVTSLSSEVVNSTASANSLSSESLNFQPAQSHEIIYPNQIEVEMASGERTIAIPELKAMLRTQLEYYFSRENLSTDAYLISQMDSDNFVPISTIAKFNQIRRLTEDISLVVEVLRESAVVQVDEAGEKVRPNPRSGVLILREIPETTPLKELEELFSSENCPKFSRCEFAHNNSWYVLFDTDEDTQKAYRYLREEAKTFNGKPIMARIKAKAITSAPFTTSYKNGVNNTQETENYNSPTVNPQQQTPVQYTYTNVPNENYSNQVCPPFYPPTMLQAWAPSTPACVDLGTVLSVNGLSPQAAFRPLNNNTNRHSYSSRDRPVKTYTPQNYNFSRSEQSRYFNRGQSTSYLQRQQLHQQPSFPSIVNTNSCGFEYMPYTSRSRNLPNFGMDMNFFTAPNLYYNKLPSLYPAHASQARHNPVLVPRNQVGLGAINSQDQSYLTVGSSTVLPFSKDSVLNSTSSSISSKQNTESQAKDNWGASQRQQRGKRYWKENGNSNSSKSLSENSNGMINKSLNENDAKPDSPKFDLENSSFPPLPGCLESDVIDVDVYESRLSDIVKGTVKPTTRDTKTQTSESALVCTTKDSSTITIEETVIAPDGAFTPPMSPEMVKENVSSSDPMPADTPRDGNEWETFVESPNENTLCNTSINALNVVPDVPAAFPAGSSPAFHSVSTNSMVNGSIVGSETSGNVSAVTESEPTVNVPSDIIENKQTAVVKLPKAKQLDSLPKSRPCDLPSPKNKTPDASSAKNKFDAFKERQSSNSKHRSSFSNNKNAESSSSKERVNELISCNTKTVEHNVTKNVEVFPLKEKQNQGYSKGRILESNSSKSKSLDTDSSLLSVNGHADSESTVSSEDEKPFRKLTYSEVAMRAKEKVEKIAQELKEKERQEAMVRHHRQQEIVAQNKQAATRKWPF
ncbi:la-related protein 4-like isoform X2 [Uloborus diversus]|uniref:la-related protein 4-like isoform X2 n=1 Tax=Uloborus diversus TaxID=327109 RepID=UPI0024093824|nr:la-related protein 4-like isoform X2 [Uloborus diversus]